MKSCQSKAIMNGLENVGDRITHFLIHLNRLMLSIIVQIPSIISGPFSKSSNRLIKLSVTYCKLYVKLKLWVTKGNTPLLSTPYLSNFNELSGRAQPSILRIVTLVVQFQTEQTTDFSTSCPIPVSARSPKNTTLDFSRKKAAVHPELHVQICPNIGRTFEPLSSCII